MKSSEIPWLVFSAIAASLREELEADHLGGKRIISPLPTLDGWAVFNDHPQLKCSSCKIYRKLTAALKDCWPTCIVQVGPHSVGWDEKEKCLKQKLQASFLARHPSPPFKPREEGWIAMVRSSFNALVAQAEPEEYLEPVFMD